MITDNLKTTSNPDQCPECGTMLHRDYYREEGIFIETVWYCEGCGYTATER